MIFTEKWRTSLEKICIPIAALAVSLVIFGVLCVAAGANPFAVYASIYKAAFGSWFSFQNTLIRVAPLMLGSLCTALPARSGLVIIGNEGAIERRFERCGGWAGCAGCSGLLSCSWQWL